jgi:hypothetical protein
VSQREKDEILAAFAGHKHAGRPGSVVRSAGMRDGVLRPSLPAVSDQQDEVEHDQADPAEPNRELQP